LGPQIEEKDKYKRKIIAWLELIAESSKEKISSMAKLDLSLAREKQDKEKAIEMIINMVNEASSMNDSLKSKLYKHMEFNVTNSCDKDKYERLVKGAIKKDKTLDFVKNDSRIKFLLE